MPKRERTNYGMSIRCFYDDASGRHYTQHYQQMPLSDIPRWLEAYKFTHPGCTAITVKVWFSEPEQDGPLDTDD